MSGGGLLLSSHNLQMLAFKVPQKLYYESFVIVYSTCSFCLSWMKIQETDTLELSLV